MIPSKPVTRVPFPCVSSHQQSELRFRPYVVQDRTALFASAPPRMSAEIGFEAFKYLAHGVDRFAGSPKYSEPVGAGGSKQFFLNNACDTKKMSLGLDDNESTIRVTADRTGCGCIRRLSYSVSDSWIVWSSKAIVYRQWRCQRHRYRIFRIDGRFWR